MEKLLPIKFFEKRKVDEQLTEAGGSKTPPKWVLEGDALTQHAQQLSGSMAKVSASFEAYKQEEHELPMVMTTIITEDALLEVFFFLWLILRLQIKKAPSHLLSD